MENNQKINLLSQREFGDSYNLVLDFLRQNLGVILKGMIILVPIVMIAMIPFIAMQSELLELTRSNTFLSSPDDIWEFYGRFLTPYTILAYIVMLVVGITLPLYPMCYIVLYVKSENGKVLISDVWRMVKKVVLPLFVCNILAVLMLSLGFILCIIPGVIIGVYIVYYPYAYASENAGIFGSFGKSFQLVKGNWWYTFLTLLITFVIMFLVSLVFSLPNTISSLGATFFGDSLFANPIMSYFTYLIAYIGGLFTYIFFAIVVGVMYYNRVATTGDYGVEQQIENIGTNCY